MIVKFVAPLKWLLHPCYQIIYDFSWLDRLVCITRVNRAEESGGHYSSSEEHLDWFKIDFNLAEIISVQDYKHT